MEEPKDSFDFGDMFERIRQNSKTVNVEKGDSLLKNMANSNLDGPFALASGDGSIDGAFYLLYKHLQEAGAIDHLPGMGGENTDIMLITLPSLKYMMYVGFIIGASQMQNVRKVEDMWNIPDADEPPYKNIKNDDQG